MNCEMDFDHAMRLTRADNARRCIYAPLLIVLSLVVPGRAGPAPETQPASVPAAPERVESLIKPSSVPADASQLDAIKGRVAARILELTEAVPAATQPAAATQPRTPEERRAADVASLLVALRDYQAVLEQFGTVRAQVDDRGAAETVAAELKTLEDQIAEVKEDMPSRRDQLDEESVRRAQLAAEAARQDVATRQAAQTQRIERNKTAAAQKVALATAAAEAQTAHLARASEFSASWAAARDAAERDAVLFELEVAHARASAANLQQTVLDLEGQRDQRLTTQSFQRLPKLRELMAAHEQRASEFERIFALGERDLVRERIKWAGTDFEKYGLAVKLDIIEAGLELAAREAKAELSARFRDDIHKEQQEERGRDLVFWHQFVNSLHRRPSGQIQARFLQIEERLEFWASEQDALRRLVDRTYDDRATIEKRMDELDDAIRARYEEWSLRSTAGVENPAKLRGELTSDMSAHKERFDEALARFGNLTQRLETATTEVADHILELSRIRRRIYWSYLTVPNPPIWRYRIAQSRQEWTSPEQINNREQSIASIRTSLSQVTRGEYAGLVGLLVAVTVGAVLFRARLVRYARTTENRVAETMQEAGLSIAPISDRLNFQGARIIARAGLLVWPSLAGLAWARVTAAPWDLAVVGFGFLGAVGAAEALIGILFSRAKPRFRLFPCSNVVATHYRKWMRTLLWFSAIAVPIPLLLTTLDWAPETRRHVWAAYKVVALAIVLAFGSRRQTVLRIVGRPESVRRPTLFALVSASYPIMYLFLIGLLIAVLVGYNALTTYIVSGVLFTVGIYLGAGAITNYLRDLAEKHRQRRLAHIVEEVDEEEAETQPGDARAAALAAGQEVALVEEETADAALSLDVLLVVVRAAVWVGAVSLMVGAWGIRWVDVRGWTDVVLLEASADGRPAITLSLALVALGIVLSSWIVSRTLRSVLESRIYETLSNLDRGGRVALSTVLHYTILLLGLYFALYTLRIPLGALTVVLGTLGLGLGLGLQPLFVNFFSGLIMLFERHLKLGDIIEIDGTLAEVTKISVRATAIKTFDNVDMLVPNSEFVNRQVVNCTHRDARIRGKIAVGVAYGTEPRLVERLLLQVAQENPTVLSDPAPRVRFMNFGESSLDFMLYVWFNNIQERWDFITDSRYRIVELFKENGVQIPFPQRTLSTVGGEALRLRIETSREQDGVDTAEAIRALRASPPGD